MGIEAGGEGGGRPRKPFVREGAVDRAAVAVDHVQRGAVIAPDRCRWLRRSGPTPTQPGSSRRRRRGSARRRRTRFGQGGEFHGGDLLLKDACAAPTGGLMRIFRVVWLAAQGSRYWSRSYSPNYDLVADMDGRLVRVWRSKPRHSFGSAAWGRERLHPRRKPELERRYQEARREELRYLFVLVRDGRRFHPIESFGGGRGLRLGGPKYAAFEVEPGDPIPKDRISDRLYNRRSQPPRGMSERPKEEAL